MVNSDTDIVFESGGGGRLILKILTSKKEIFKNHTNF